ncbi:response regulator [Desulfovibrio sp. OttesenSCG-928-F20]|nr:response regulator [Desulfovibrio sp. OttesenSCG-928-F20]
MLRFLKSNLMLALFFASALIVLVIAISASKMMLASAQMIEESTKRRMAALSEAASMLVTGEELDLFMNAPDMDKPEYTALKNRLDEFTRRANVMFTYYMRLTAENKMQFVIDNVLDPAEQDGLNSKAVPREAGPDRALLGEVLAVDLGDYSTGWDGLLTAWAPVRYSDGSLSNMVAGVDMQDVFIKEARSNRQALAVLLTVSLVVVLVVCLACMLMYMRKARQSNIASEAKSSFLSRMSHEMRTPMNAIIGLCAMASKSQDMGVIRDYLDNINTASHHLRHVIDDILDISKIESGKMKLSCAPASLRREVEYIKRIIKPQSEAQRQKFTICVDDAVPDWLVYDSTHLRQVVINLLSNAVKFTPEGGQIDLCVKLLENTNSRVNLEWRVRDTGIGIPPQHMGSLFAPFEQADASNTRKYGGTGLGLAISRQLVELMGGAIRVESEQGRGSEFIFNTWLDIAAPGTETAVDKRAENFDQALNLWGKRILLVEDSDINQMIAVAMLNDYGAEVNTANNGEEGLRAFEAAPDSYDLIFMDIQMPVMDGYEATRRIRASNLLRAGSIPIIAMTANVFKEDVDKAREAGMNGHVGKPLDVEQIRETVHRVLRENGAPYPPPGAIKTHPLS